MHIAEGILPSSYAAATWALAIPPILWGSRWLHAEAPDEQRHRLTLASMSTALVFATTLLPIPIPVAGVTSHLCATPLLALVLGPRAIIVPALLSLAVQALFLGHGGITTLGANLLSLGVVGPSVAWSIARALRCLHVSTALTVFLACALGEVAVYFADAVLLGVALSASATFSKVFLAIALGFAPVQIPLAILEGLVSAFTLGYLARRQSHLLPDWLARVHTVALSFLFAVLVLCPIACGGPMRGADGAVMGHVATQAGRPPKPWFDPGDERVLGLASLSSFIAGIVVARFWGRLRKGGRGVS